MRLDAEPRVVGACEIDEPEGVVLERRRRRGQEEPLPEHRMHPQRRHQGPQRRMPLLIAGHQDPRPRRPLVGEDEHQPAVHVAGEEPEPGAHDERLFCREPLGERPKTMAEEPRQRALLGPALDRRASHIKSLDPRLRLGSSVVSATQPRAEVLPRSAKPPRQTNGTDGGGFPPSVGWRSLSRAFSELARPPGSRRGRPQRRRPCPESASARGAGTRRTPEARSRDRVPRGGWR